MFIFLSYFSLVIFILFVFFWYSFVLEFWFVGASVCLCMGPGSADSDALEAPAGAGESCARGLGGSRGFRVLGIGVLGCRKSGIGVRKSDLGFRKWGLGFIGFRNQGLIRN